MEQLLQGFTNKRKEGYTFDGLPFLRIGITLAFFHSELGYQYGMICCRGNIMMGQVLQRRVLKGFQVYYHDHRLYMRPVTSIRRDFSSGEDKI